MGTKRFFLSVVFTMITFLSFSQSEKMNEKAVEWTKTLNTQIISINESLPLNEEQTEKIVALQIQKLQEIKKIKDNGDDQKAKKAVNKKYYQKIFKEVLTKEQMLATREAKKKASKE